MMNSFYQDDDISILQGEDELSAPSPDVIPFFNLTASRHQLPIASGITSMDALRNAYEELKKKYNDLNIKYDSLLVFIRKNRLSDGLLEEPGPSSYSSLDDKSKTLQMSRKDEIEKLHGAIQRLNQELLIEKSKNVKLQVQMSYYKDTSTESTLDEEPNAKPLNILEDLEKNIDILEKSVEIHKSIINKQLPNLIQQQHSKTQPFLGKSDFISQRKQQSEHDELSSLGNNPSQSPIKTACSSAATAAGPAVITVPSRRKSKQGDFEMGPRIIDLKNTKQKQEKQQNKTQTPAPLPLHLCTEASPSSVTNTLPSSSSSITTTTTSTTTTTTGIVREKKFYLNNAESACSGEKLSGKSSGCLSEMLCPICEAPFTDLSKFQEHVFDCKIDTSDRNCPVCMKNFSLADQEEFEKHVHTHFDQPTDDFVMF